jgi:GcrA cell cycle regulator
MQKWVKSDTVWNKRFDWTNSAAVTELKNLWLDGNSGAQCAMRLCHLFGGYLTHSAVIGKVHRLGLSGRSVISRKIRARPCKKTARRKLSKPFMSISEQARRAALGTVEDREIAQATPDIVIPEKDRINIADLPEDACKWPFGDGPFHFGCPHGRITGLPYCDFHARRAFTPPPEKAPRAAKWGGSRDILAPVKEFDAMERA